MFKIHLFLICHWKSFSRCVIFKIVSHIKLKVSSLILFFFLRFSFNPLENVVRGIKWKHWEEKGHLTVFRSSHRRCSVRKCVFRNFSKFTGKQLCQNLFFNKVQAWGLKKETLAQVFSCEFWEISKNIFFAEHLWATASLYSHRKTSDSWVWTFKITEEVFCKNRSWNISSLQKLSPGGVLSKRCS